MDGIGVTHDANGGYKEGPPFLTTLHKQRRAETLKPLALNLPMADQAVASLMMLRCSCTMAPNTWVDLAR
jgi:hypothetical protein